MQVENFAGGAAQLTLFDGAQPSAPVLAHLTEPTSQQLIISTQSQLYVYFSSSGALPGDALRLSFKKGCDNVLRAAQGSLLAPGHGRRPYPPAQHCRYSIDLPGAQAQQPVSLSVHRFELAPGDSLHFTEEPEAGRGLNASFSADHPPPRQLASRRGKLSISFQSDALHSAGGWNISYSTSELFSLTMSRL